MRRAGRQRGSSGEFVEADCDSPEVFELAEEALDPVALAVDGRINRSLDLAITLSWDACLPAARPDQVDGGPSVIGAIGDEGGGWWQAICQSTDHRLVRGQAVVGGP